MRTVWVVMYFGGGDASPCGVYSSEKEAKRAIDICCKASGLSPRECREAKQDFIVVDLDFGQPIYLP